MSLALISFSCCCGHLWHEYEVPSTVAVIKHHSNLLLDKMATQVLPLAPDLTVSVVWSYRMQEIWQKYYPELWEGRPCADEQLRQEYSLWQQRLEVSCQHIQRFFKLTGSLPVAGDLLYVSDRRLNAGLASLSIETRSLLTSCADDEVRVLYEVQSTTIELLEFWGGRLEKPADWF